MEIQNQVKRGISFVPFLYFLSLKQSLALLI